MFSYFSTVKEKIKSWHLFLSKIFHIIQYYIAVFYDFSVFWFCLSFKIANQFFILQLFVKKFLSNDPFHSKNCPKVKSNLFAWQKKTLFYSLPPLPKGRKVAHGVGKWREIMKRDPPLLKKSPNGTVSMNTCCGSGKWSDSTSRGLVSARSAPLCVILNSSKTA